MDLLADHLVFLRSKQLVMTFTCRPDLGVTVRDDAWDSRFLATIQYEALLLCGLRANRGKIYRWDDPRLGTRNGVFEI